MEHTATYLGYIPLFPLIGALVVGLLHMFTCKKNPLPEKLYGAIGCVGPILSTFLAVVVYFHLKGMPEEERALVHNAHWSFCTRKISMLDARYYQCNIYAQWDMI